MPVPFGVSVGDFISALAALRTILHALEDTHGAGAQYRAIITMFDNLETSLTQLASFECGARLCLLPLNRQQGISRLRSTVS
jgi:crotonobetainyl-CoA:carnitine CoA-transferase CaiB-like acyl-CoA transferase